LTLFMHGGFSKPKENLNMDFCSRYFNITSDMLWFVDALRLRFPHG
jgi:hypothetical protein